MNKYIALINSNTVREHLDKIKFKPSSLEAAYIIEKNTILTVKEKHTLWHEIISTMPDEDLQKEFKCGIHTLHEFLKGYMKIQNTLCEKFLKPEENAVYSCSTGVLTDSSANRLISNPFYWCNIYSTLDLCVQDARDKHHSTYDVRKHYLKTDSNDKDYMSIWADLTPDREIMNIDEIFILNGPDTEIYHFFQLDANINIPLPFKKGDVLNYKSPDGFWREQVIVKRYEQGCVYVSRIDETKDEVFQLIDNLGVEFADESYI